MPSDLIRREYGRGGPLDQGRRPLLEEEAEVQAMFDRAWESLSQEEREAERRERDALLDAYV